MNLALTRVWLNNLATIGVLDVDAVFACYTLERPAVQIPMGVYPVTLYQSPHFQRLVPLLNVPGRTFIEMHFGNYPEESDGCILLGKTRMNQIDIGNSVAAFDAFFPKLQAGLAAGPVSLTVTEDMSGTVAWPGA